MIHHYTLDLFLLMKGSGERFISALLDHGFSVSPTLKDGRVYICGDVSTVAALRLACEEKDLKKVHDQIVEVLKDKEIPCFGFVLDGPGTSYSMIFSGYMPVIKKKALERGVYRSQSDKAEIIPFPSRDDGIVDDPPRQK